MSDESLEQVLDDAYRVRYREVAIQNLGERTHLTIEKLAKLVAHKDHGPTIKDITLQDLLDVTLKNGKSAAAPAVPAPVVAAAAAPAAPVAAKTTKKVTKKAAKKATKKVTKKAAKKAAKKTTKKGPKADKGKPKPRLDYEVGKREVLAAIKAARGPVGRGDIETATGFTGVQVRTFAKALKVDGKVKVLGEGGRSTKYDVA